MGQHTLHSFNTRVSPRAQPSMSPMIYPLASDDTLNYVCCVCLWDRSAMLNHLFMDCAFHWIQIPFRCISFTPLHGVQTPFPPNNVPHPNYHFSPSCFLNMSVGEALLRWASSMMFNTDASKVRIRSLQEWPKRWMMGKTTFVNYIRLNPNDADFNQFYIGFTPAFTP